MQMAARGLIRGFGTCVLGVPRRVVSPCCVTPPPRGIRGRGGGFRVGRVASGHDRPSAEAGRQRELPVREAIRERHVAPPSRPAERALVWKFVKWLGRGRAVGAGCRSGKNCFDGGELLVEHDWCATAGSGSPLGARQWQSVCTQLCTLRHGDGQQRERGGGVSGPQAVYQSGSLDNDVDFICISIAIFSGKTAVIVHLNTMNVIFISS